jgi:hypothetical protein
MCHHGLLGAFASAVMAISIGSAAAWDDAKYPDLQGHWARFAVPGVTGQPSFDQTKPWGSGQQAPLTPEYRAIFEASLADQAKGGEGNYAAHARCIAAGMPHMMVAFRPLEFVVTANTTYILIADIDHYRRNFTDGNRAHLSGLFDRPLDRRGRRRTLRRARGGNARIQGAALVRRHRAAAAF